MLVTAACCSYGIIDKNVGVYLPFDDEAVLRLLPAGISSSQGEGPKLHRVTDNYCNDTVTCSIAAALVETATCSAGLLLIRVVAYDNIMVILQMEPRKQKGEDFLRVAVSLNRS